MAVLRPTELDRPAGRRLPEPQRVLVPVPPARRPGWRRGIAIAAVLLLVALAVKLRRDFPIMGGPAAIPAIRTAMVQSGVVEQTVRLTGNTAAERSVQLRAPYLRGRRSTSPGDYGLVLERLVTAGAAVEQGEIVAAFDPLQMTHRLDDNRADRQDSEAEVRKVSAALRIARGQRQQAIRVAKGEREKAAVELRTIPVRSAIQAALLRLRFEEADAIYKSLVSQETFAQIADRAQLRTAELVRDEAIVEERRAEANIAKMTVQAPISGIAIPGDMFRGTDFSPIRRGDQVRPGQMYLQIVDPRSMIVEASANQVDVDSLRIGAIAQVRFDGHHDLQLRARVYSIGPLAKGSRSTASFVAAVPVYLKFTKNDPRLIPNLTVSADVVIESRAGKAIVPREAVFDAGPGESPVVYVKDGRAWEERKVELGLRNHVVTAIRSGVEPGEVVALENPILWRPGNAGDS